MLLFFIKNHLFDQHYQEPKCLNIQKTSYSNVIIQKECCCFRSFDNSLANVEKMQPWLKRTNVNNQFFLCNSSLITAFLPNMTTFRIIKIYLRKHRKILTVVGFHRDKKTMWEQEENINFLHFLQCLCQTHQVWSVFKGNSCNRLCWRIGICSRRLSKTVWQNEE